MAPQTASSATTHEVCFSSPTRHQIMAAFVDSLPPHSACRRRSEILIRGINSMHSPEASVPGVDPRQQPEAAIEKAPRIVQATYLQQPCQGDDGPGPWTRSSPLGVSLAKLLPRSWPRSSNSSAKVMAKKLEFFCQCHGQEAQILLPSLWPARNQARRPQSFSLHGPINRPHGNNTNTARLVLPLVGHMAKSGSGSGSASCILQGRRFPLLLSPCGFGPLSWAAARRLMRQVNAHTVPATFDLTFTTFTHVRSSRQCRG